MAKKKQASGESALSQESINRLWTALTIDSWLDLLHRFHPDVKWKQKGRGDIWGKCPNPHHSKDNTASFHIQPEKGYAKCFGCDWFEADPVKLAATMMGRPYGDAFTYIITTYGITSLAPTLVQEAQDLARRYEIKNNILSIVNAELVQAAGAGRTDPQFEYAQPLVKWLEERKIDPTLLHTLPIGVVPPADRLWGRMDDLERIIKERRHDEIQTYLKEIIPASRTVTGNYEGWLVFANHITPGQIGQFRLRKPGTKDLIFVREPDNKHPRMGFFGLGAPAYASIIGNGEHPASKSVVVVEGEFDALAVLHEQVVRGDVRQIVVAAGGNNNHCLDPLLACGFEEALILGDRDLRGKEFAKSHLQATRMPSKMFDWPANMVGVKDLHDAWRLFGGDMLLDEVTNPDNWTRPHIWAIRDLTGDLSSYEPTDVAGRTRAALQTGRLLSHPAEQSDYISAAAKLIGCDESELRKHLASTDTDEGFITLLEEYIKKNYLILYKDNLKGGVTVTMWYRDRSKVTVFDTTKSATVAGAIKSDVGSIVQWVEGGIGTLGRLKAKVDPDTGRLEEGKNFDTRDQEYQKLLVNHAIPNLVRAAPLLTSLSGLGQGIHYKEGANTTGGRQFYVVNGRCFLQGVVRSDGGMFWKQVEGPATESFFVEDAALGWEWSRNFRSAEDVNNHPPVDLPKMFARAKKLLHLGWRFKEHDLETTYLAGLVFAAALGDIFTALPWIFVNAPYQTGKTNLLLNMLSNTNKSSDIHLLEASVGTDYFTEAGVRQQMNNATLMLILDEFEVGTDSRNLKNKERAARNILDLMKGAQAGAGTRVLQGSVGGRAVKFHLRFAFAAAGINQLVERADMSRFNFVALDASQAKGLPGSPLKNNELAPGEAPPLDGSTPTQRILAQLSADDIDELRRNITMFCLQNAEKVRREYLEVCNEFQTGAFFHPGTEGRLKEGLLPVITILKMAGVDYKAFVAAYSKYKVEELAQNTHPTQHDDVWNTILQIARVTVPGDEYRGRVFSLGQLLARPDLRHLINETDTGVFYLEGPDLLVINWATFVHSNLARGTKLQGLQHGAAKAMLLNDRRVLSPKAVIASGASGLIHQLTGMKRPETMCSVIPVKDLIGTISTTASYAPTKPADPLAEAGMTNVAGIKDQF